MPKYLRGEIWDVSFEPAEGSETDKTRPAVVVSEDELGALDLRIVVPLTNWKQWYEKAEWIIEFKATKDNGLDKRSGADCFQVRSVSITRIEVKRGVATPGQVDELAAGIALCVGWTGWNLADQ